MRQLQIPAAVLWGKLTAVLLLATHSHVILADDTFENHIRPLLARHCVECHSGNTPDGDLVLSDQAGFAAGGMSGPLVDREDISASLLLARLVTDDEDLRMPPEAPLSEEEIALFRNWVEAGAGWTEGDASVIAPQDANASADNSRESHWAFQPIVRPVLPSAEGSDWAWGDLDRFINARQVEAGVMPVDDTALTTWLRRVTLKLTGLPPQAEDVAEASQVSDDPQQQAAYRQQVIERLLASHAYAECQARHWLDVARYADTSGDGTDTPIPEAIFYRDWVIEAFAADKPYDQFLIEQIAGDVLAKQNPDSPEAYKQVIATGYIALSRRFGNSRFAEMHQIIDDTIDTIGKSTMGLSLGCARCHHHKFDPVTMQDYYGLYGYFASTQYPHAGTEHQKERSDMPTLTLTEAQTEALGSNVAWAVSDKPETSDARIHLAGDPGRKGDVARRGFLAFLAAGETAEIAENQSGRLQLARWIASAKNPLTARVMVNRIWQIHFGKGLVDNPSSFGVQCLPPSHPQLLDYLASELIDSGWSLKHIHRLIVSSHTYALSSRPKPTNVASDEANRWLSYFPRTRMNAEAFRDSMLAVSGDLEEGSGGRHPFKPTAELKYSQGNPFAEIFDHNRRSVYLMTPRLKRHPMLALFDGADANTTTGKRGESTVPLQSLFVMNGDFVRARSASLASRLIAASENDPERVELLWNLAYGRQPLPAESQEVLDYITTFQQSVPAGDSSEASGHAVWTSVARVILGSNEFIYID